MKINTVVKLNLDLLAQFWDIIILNGKPRLTLFNSLIILVFIGIVYLFYKRLSILVNQTNFYNVRFTMRNTMNMLFVIDSNWWWKYLYYRIYGVVFVVGFVITAGGFIWLICCFLKFVFWYCRYEYFRFFIKKKHWPNFQTLKKSEQQLIEEAIVVCFYNQIRSHDDVKKELEKIHKRKKS